MVDILDLVANQQKAFSPTPLHLDRILGWGTRGTTGTQFFADQLNSPFLTSWLYFALNITTGTPKCFHLSGIGCVDFLVNPKRFPKV